MRKRHIILLIFILLLAVPVACSAYKLKETWQRSFEVDEGVEFILRNVNGGIEIKGWDKDEIDVFAEIEIKAPSKSKAEKLYEKLKFDVEAERDRVEIEAKRPRVRQDGLFGGLFGDKTILTIRYRVKVPASTNLEIENTNGGITVDKIEGTFNCHTVNGGITIRSFRGDGVANTVNGGIECSIENFPEDGDLRLKTVNGGIELWLPDDAGGYLEAKTVNGGIDLDIELREKVRIKRSSVKGVIGEGDGSVYLKTVNGGISIEPY